MGRNKERFIKATGGLRLGDTPQSFKARVEKIEKLEALLRSGTLHVPDEVELVQRQICELKGENFDDPDPEDLLR
jgi:hypothetical protein